MQRPTERLRELVEDMDSAAIVAHVVPYCEDVTLFGVDYTPLPLDADGVPIHAGDMLDGYGKTIEVVEMRYGRSGWVIVSRNGNAYADCAAFSHHYATTVEDVLREFADEVQRCCDTEDTIAEYAARLMLAGEDA